MRSRALAKLIRALCAHRTQTQSSHVMRWCMQECQTGASQSCCSFVLITPAALPGAWLSSQRPFGLGCKQRGGDQPPHQAISPVGRCGRGGDRDGRAPAAQQHCLRPVQAGLLVLLPFQPAESRYSSTLACARLQGSRDLLL